MPFLVLFGAFSCLMSAEGDCRISTPQTGTSKTEWFPGPPRPLDSRLSSSSTRLICRPPQCCVSESYIRSSKSQFSEQVQNSTKHRSPSWTGGATIPGLNIANVSIQGTCSLRWRSRLNQRRPPLQKRTASALDMPSAITSLTQPLNA